MPRIVKLGFLLILLTFAQQLGAAGFTVDAQVDRNEVGFGESFTLAVTLSQSLTAGRTNRLNMPAIESIPGFDIASTRSGQSTTYINGVGQTRSQIVYELVPQQPGKAIIPAFSFQDSNGDTVTTDPIEINVQAPDEAPEDKPTQPQPAVAGSDGGSMFRSLLLAGLVIGGTVALLFIFSAFFDRKGSFSSPRQQNNGDSQSAQPGQENSEKTANKIEDAEVVTASEFVAAHRQRVNFFEAVAKLKRQYPDADSAFYTEYFTIFKNAMLGNSGAVSADMTMDELFHKVCSINSREDVALACKRLAGDMELVMYANRPPSRSFNHIDTDAREIINAISE